MAFITSARVVIIAFCLHTVFARDIHIEALKPKGFRVWINDEPGLIQFVFHGRTYNPTNRKDVKIITGRVTAPKDGKWFYEDTNIELKVGDMIDYNFSVSLKGGMGEISNDARFTVEKLEPRTINDAWIPACEPTITKVRGGSACGNVTIFEDHFNSLDEGRWQIEQYIPKNHVEYPFVSYQKLNSNPAVKVENGVLHISAKLQEGLNNISIGSLNTGSLNLFQGCTAPGELCVKQVTGADIIPPVVAGRITSKNFAFTYGTVYVRAKMPKGDWLYPEILLESVAKKYGTSDYYSGVIKIAAARGNTLLYADGTDYSNKVLYGGPIMSLQCRNTLLKSKSSGDSNWGDDFHLYAVRWTQDSITLTVDGEEWGRVDRVRNGLRNLIPRKCKIPRNFLSMGTKLAPFDDHFQLTLGIAAGGMSEFPDNSYTTDHHPKPWKNGQIKSMLNFWQDTAWFNTWTQPELLIDSIKVVAL